MEWSGVEWSDVGKDCNGGDVIRASHHFGALCILPSHHNHINLFIHLIPTHTPPHTHTQTHPPQHNMADAGRQSLSDKVGAAVKPDSQKGFVESAGDSIKGALDSVASAVQPQHEKSVTQKAG